MDSQNQQFCLKWNSFGSNLATAFGNLFKSESLTDVTLFCDGVSLKAHKVILAACSKHFQDLFEVAPPCPGTVVILDGMSAPNMAALLEFMYKGEVHVSQDCLSSFLKAAECLQVKGLSIEHEKLASSETYLDGRASPACSESGQSPHRKTPKLNNHSVPSPMSDPTDLTSPTTPTFSSVIAPYMPSYHRPYERSNSTSAVVAMPPTVPYKRQRRSLADADSGGTNGPSSCLDSSSAAIIRASVLRDGKGRSTTLSPADLTAANYRGHNEGQTGDSTRYNNDCEATDRASTSSGNPASNSSVYDRPPLSVGSGSGDRDQESNKDEKVVGSSQSSGNGSSYEGCPESPVCRKRGRPPSTSLVPTDLRVKMEPLHATGLRGDELSAVSFKELKQQVAAAAAAASGNDKAMAASLWNASTKQAAHKGGSVATPDGKKLKCPFCERLYGYETNLRAHIRQRHQGIRVPCPFCSRTFTRNNTVRRHIAREHKTELSMKTAAAASAAVAAAAAASGCFPLPNHSQ
ncbi:zinc finger protein chinmo [Neocloeon triangulifer]|uniref:zinc finger protein chinmo n=1 Tax=Neocloeon triangulifer TaxID=2078957 RepID=UPI00286F2742|nr:zinc finger protein chinmo [Neocloeon triangulifer]XP_059474016.1 zinc finger protein chinmo [Neocloeon triangulifer]XP_059474017.1 zinc finger protein chinmo [Neocloeon triangulifer]